MAIKYSTAARNAKMDTLTTSIGTSAKLRIYSGTRPANPAAAITGTLLAELICSASAFAAASSGGVLTANAIASGTGAASGTATHFRLWKSDGTTAVVDGDVAISGADLNINNTSIASGQTVSVSSFALTENNG